MTKQEHDTDSSTSTSAAAGVMDTVEMQVVLSEEPMHLNGVTSQRSSWRAARVDRIAKVGRHYKARLAYPEQDDPHALYSTNAWRHTRKNRNKHLNIPVLEDGEEIEAAKCA